MMGSDNLQGILVREMGLSLLSWTVALFCEVVPVSDNLEVRSLVAMH